MKVLVIGGGGREHALCWKLSQSKSVRHIYAWPGNPGIARVAERVSGNVMDIARIADFAEEERVDLTIVGPESPLGAGIVDEFEQRGLLAFGPNKEAAQIEVSKVFSKSLMVEGGIPTGGFEVFDDPDKANAYIESIAGKTDNPIPVKADGEAAGKGAFMAKTKVEALQAVDIIMRQRAFGASGDRLVIEEFLDGPEVSFLCFVDGETFVPMTPAQDYKRIDDNDQGPNTGGMGCYSPVPVFTDEVRATVIETIVKPTLRALKSRGIHYSGVLYVGLALTSNGPKVIEFNARFGDPETQVILPLLETDLADIALAVAEGRLDSQPVSWYDKKAVCVVMASGGYPGDYGRGKVITGLDQAERAGAVVFHAGTETKGGQVVTAGGRVLGVTAVGDTYRNCIDKAYAGVRAIQFDGVGSRTDIGARVA